ncbi:MAG TPA: LamG-like jellyroll fold domain-containing protein [Alphaproteobacteria bacterium]
MVKIYCKFLLLAALAAFVSVFFAPDARAANSYTVADGATVTIDEWGGCRRVTNNHASNKSLFVPTKTLTEWQTFVNNPPAGVSVATCGEMTLLLHCDGTDGGTTFSNPGTGPALSAGGNTITDTGRKKFGTASCYFDGAGDYLYSDNTSYWDQPGEFMIEMWVYVASGSDPLVGFVDLGPSGVGMFLEMTGGANFRGHFNGTYQTSTSFTKAAWHHVAFSRTSGGVIRTYLDGTEVSQASGYTSAEEGGMTLGTYRNQRGTSTYALTGWIDEVRMLRGTGSALYTGNTISVPAEAFW